MGNRYHYALSWSLTPLQLICKGCSFHISLPETFTLSLKFPPHLRVLSSASAYFLVNQSHWQRNLFRICRRQLLWCKKLEEEITLSVASQHQVPFMSP